MNPGVKRDTVKRLRIPPELQKAIRYRARREHLDESTATRQLIRLGAEEYAVRLYRDGTLTLNQAAEVASATPREMLDILWEHGVRGNVTLRQHRKALEHLRTALPG